MHTIARTRMPLIGLLLVAAGCGEDTLTALDETGEAPQVAAFQELYDQGIDRYLGVFTPTASQPLPNGAIQHFFSGEDGGPMCYTGQPFSMYTRDGSGNDLLIFTQGGGFCGPAGCAAVEQGIPLIPFGILDPNDPGNPAANFDVGYLPYCDGCAMMGDAEVDRDQDGVADLYFRGVQNLSASLDVIVRAYPNPDRILLAGNSAGGFAVHAALPLVRKLYPEVPIDVINDSGVGILDPGGWDRLVEYWNASAFIPESCPNCVGPDGNLTELHAWQLQRDENFRLAYLSATRDETISQTLAGGGASLELQLVEAVRELQPRWPERFQALVPAGTEHTFILSDFDHDVGGVTVREWVTAMLDGGADWETRIEGY